MKKMRGRRRSSTPARSGCGGFSLTQSAVFAVAHPASVPTLGFRGYVMLACLLAYGAMRSVVGTRASHLWIPAAAILCGCASSHNLETDGFNPLGGGYSETKVRDGVYQIFVQTNWAPWLNLSGARSAWRDRAAGLCGAGRFREFEIFETSYDQVPPYMHVRYIVTTRNGYAVCDAAHLSDAEALAVIHHPAPAAHREPLAGLPIEPGHPMSGKVLDIRAPNSEGWQLIHNEGDRVEFAKHAPAADETYAAQVLRFEVPEMQSADEFTAFMKERIAKGMNPERFDVRSMQVARSAARPYPCASVEFVALDKNARTPPNATGQLLLQAISLYCRHPSRPGLGFAIIFSHRGEALDPNLREPAEDFIRNVNVPPSK